MKDIIIQQFSQEDFQVTQSETSATTVTLLMRNKTTLVVYAVTAPYVAGKANLTLTAAQTSVVGDYDYQINENVPNEDPYIFAKGGCASGDCGFPTITICPSIVVS